jgi:NAD+ diphosphatase
MEENNYLSFLPEVIAYKEKSDNDLWFVFHENKILVIVKEESYAIPTWNDILKLNIDVKGEHFLGELRGTSCYTLELKAIPSLSPNLEFTEFRMAGDMMGEELFFLCGRASQVLYWDNTHKFCSRCGSATDFVHGERAKRCPECGFITYPRICPAIITAVTKDDKILLAHNSNFPEGLYSVIAGFVEPGETFEECVKREILEEVNIKVKNIKYFSNQPWPFPNSLMIAFTAEYESGEIDVDQVEIGHADWFSIDNLPTLPSKTSVARKLINSFIESQKNNKIG